MGYIEKQSVFDCISILPMLLRVEAMILMMDLVNRHTLQS